MEFTSTRCRHVPVQCHGTSMPASTVLVLVKHWCSTTWWSPGSLGSGDIDRGAEGGGEEVFWGRERWGEDSEEPWWGREWVGSSTRSPPEVHVGLPGTFNKCTFNRLLYTL